jgi:aspartyl-tRNA(Asn)/glutamyl-tRNA(Gln) amidotransferase subunit A
MDYFSLTISELNDLYKKGEVTAEEVTKSLLQRIETVDKKINSYISVMGERALERAVEVDKKIASGDIDGNALTGIPIAVKDLICTSGVPTTCGSKILENYVPPEGYNATVMEKLEAQGAIIIGKTNMDEFAMGSSTEASAFGITKNPHNLEYVPGGSSGGSAAAVAADLCIAALGSDTGGSIRQPASYSGIVGLKPTYGRVSRFGLVAYASSLDQIGPITKDVRDAAILLNAISGHDKKDSTSIDAEAPDFTKFLTGDIKGMRVGIPKEYFGEGLDPEVNERVMEGVAVLKAGGAEIVEISLPHTEYALASYYIIASSEASSNLARYDSVRYGNRLSRKSDELRGSESEEGMIEMFMRSRSAGFGEEVKRRIMLGTYTLSSGYYDAYYKKALQVRRLIREDYDSAFEKVDVVACPAAPAPAYKIGEKIEDPLSMYLVDVYTVTANLTGIPGISVPAGTNSSGLPIGLQLLSKPLGEGDILRAAHYFEANRKAETPLPKL